MGNIAMKATYCFCEICAELTTNEHLCADCDEFRRRTERALERAWWEQERRAATLDAFFNTEVACE